MKQLRMALHCMLMYNSSGALELVDGWWLTLKYYIKLADHWNHIAQKAEIQFGDGI